MTRLSRSVTAVLVVGAASLIVASVPAAAVGAAFDTAAHQYGFDHAFTDADGGPTATVHGTVGFGAGRHDPPDATDGSARFDGRAADFLSLPAPTLDLSLIHI